jgi:arginine utilization protein RocB
MLTWDPEARAGVVFAVEEGRARQRKITIGAASAESIEVLTGVAAGETVVTRGAFDLKDGDRVTVAALASASKG